MKKLLIISIAAVFASVSFAQNGQGYSNHEKLALPTTRFTCPMHTDFISDHAGKCPKCGMNLVAKSPEIIYVCPKHSNVISHQPGRCVRCGMNLVTKKYNPNLIHFTCLKHTDIITDKPGVCPKCGKELVIMKNN